MAIGYPGTAVAVTATGIGTLTPPNQSVFGWAVVTNVSPWIATITGLAEGSGTLQPFEQDLVDLSPAGSIGYVMSVPPGGAATAPSNQPAYLQVDWYLESQGPPVGSWPFSLAAQALAAIAGTVTTITPAQLIYSGTLAAMPATVPAAPLAPGGRTIMVVFTATATLTLTGNNSGIVMAFQAGASTAGRANYIAFDSTVDTQFATSGITGAASVSVYSLGSPTATASEYPSLYANPENFTVIGGLSAANTVVAGGATTVGAALPVTTQVVQTVSDGTNAHLAKSDTSGGILSGQVPELNTAITVAGLSAGAATRPIAAVAEKVVTVYGYDISIDTAAATVGVYAATLQSTATSVPVGATRLSIRQATAVGDVVTTCKMGPLWVPGGFALPVGEGLEVLANAGNAAAIATAGVIYFTQA